MRGAAAPTWRGGRPNASMEQRPARYRRSVGCIRPTFSAAAACFTCAATPRWQQLRQRPATGGEHSSVAQRRGARDSAVQEAPSVLCRPLSAQISIYCTICDALIWVLTGMTNASTATVSSHVLFCLRPAAAQAHRRTAQASKGPCSEPCLLSASCDRTPARLLTRQERVPHLLNVARAALLQSVREQAAVRHSGVEQLLLPQQQAPPYRVQGAGALAARRCDCLDPGRGPALQTLPASRCRAAPACAVQSLVRLPGVQSEAGQA